MPSLKKMMRKAERVIFPVVNHIDEIERLEAECFGCVCEAKSKPKKPLAFKLPRAMTRHA